MARKATVSQRLQRHGFKRVNLGGNTSAWERDDGEIVERIYGDEDGMILARAPDSLFEPVHVLTGEREEVEGGEEMDDVSGYVLDDVLRALEYKSDEYYLLDLRLANFIRHGRTLSSDDVWDIAEDERTGYGGRRSPGRADLANLLEHVAEDMQDTGKTWMQALDGERNDPGYEQAGRILLKAQQKS